MILEKETYESLQRTFDDAPQKSKIICKCDYCGSIFPRLKHNIARSWQHLKKDSCSDVVCVQKKRVEVNRLVFGTDNAFQSEKIKDMIKETHKKNLGVENPMQNKEIADKQKKTCKERYGSDNVFASDVIKAKIKKLHKENLGVENPMQNKEIREKQNQKLLELYGVPYALQSAEFRQKAMETCITNFGKFPVNNYGKCQSEIKDWLNSMGFDFKSNRSLVPGREIDLYDDTKKLGIEYCGLHWHHELSPEPRDQKYHVNKFEVCLEKGVQLLTIFSDEWEKREAQCKGHIKSILGINNNRLYGRQCVVSEIPRVLGRHFFDQYHIQGKNHLGVIFFGLFHKDELVGAMSLGRHNRQFSDLVLDRLCFKEGVQIVGGASKLFAAGVKWAKEQGHKQILSFSDNRWSIGRVYEALDFQLIKYSRPDYSYVDVKKPNERISKQSQKKGNTDCPAGITEYDWAHLRGLARIWDCGKKRWLFVIK